MRTENGKLRLCYSKQEKRRYLMEPNMRTRTDDTTRMILLTVYAAALVLSCATLNNSPGPEMEATPLPTYREGTTFVYSDGTWETVIESLPARVTWSDHLGNVSSGAPDFVYRREHWQTEKRTGTRRFLTREADSLWPLGKGNTIRYTEIGTWSDESGIRKSYESQWACRVTGTVRVSVLAGNFDTWKIECRRDSVGADSGKKRKREKKTWYYAPAIGHYVLTANTYYGKRNPRRLELVAVLPSLAGLTPEERHLVQARFQQAMEYQPSGRSVSWPKTVTLFGGEITPIDTFRTSNGAFCRRYVQIFYLPEGQRIYHGMALRDAQGRWVIPRQGSES